MSATTEITCGLLAQGRIRVPLEALQALRRQPGPPGAVAPMFLKNSDEQTVVALAAVYQALQEPGLVGVDFQQWGVVAAPRFLGRTTVGFHLTRYAAEGAWGISPHVVPHRSLHSPSGTISHALHSHGPNFGVGGGPGAATEALLNGAAMLHGYRLPGVWVVITERNPELLPDPGGIPLPGAFYCALALALAPCPASAAVPRLRLVAGKVGSSPTAAILCLDSLEQALDHARQQQALVALDLEHGGHLEIAWPAQHPALPAPFAVLSTAAPLRAEMER